MMRKPKPELLLSGGAGLHESYLQAFGGIDVLTVDKDLAVGHAHDDAALDDALDVNLIGDKLSVIEHFALELDLFHA